MKKCDCKEKFCPSCFPPEQTSKVLQGKLDPQSGSQEIPGLNRINKVYQSMNVALTTRNGVDAGIVFAWHSELFKAIRELTVGKNLENLYGN